MLVEEDVPAFVDELFDEDKVSVSDTLSDSYSNTTLYGSGRRTVAVSEGSKFAGAPKENLRVYLAFIGPSGATRH